MKKTEGGVTTLYVNKYYEKNLSTSVVTLYYYLGDKMVAYKQGTDLKWVHQDHLTGTSITTTTAGNLDGAIKYKPYGETRASSGALPPQKFTGQRLDDVGLYYYGARYYDPSLARFISADSVVPGSPAGNSVVPGLMVDLTTGIISGARRGPFSPQSLNRYSYVLNNPLRYIDPTGRQEEEEDDDDETAPPDWGSLGSATDTTTATQQAVTPTDINTPAAPKEEAPPSGLTQTNDKVVSDNIPRGRRSQPGPPESMVGRNEPIVVVINPRTGYTPGQELLIGGGSIIVGGAAVIAGGIAIATGFVPAGLTLIGGGVTAIRMGDETLKGEPADPPFIMPGSIPQDVFRAIGDFGRTIPVIGDLISRAGK